MIKLNLKPLNPKVMWQQGNGYNNADTHQELQLMVISNIGKGNLSSFDHRVILGTKSSQTGFMNNTEFSVNFSDLPSH